MSAARRMWLAAGVSLWLGAGGCGGSASTSVKPEPKPASEPAEALPAAPEPEPEAGATPDAGVETTPAAQPETAAAPAAAQPAAPLPDSLDAGDIPRATVLAVLSGGVGRFLQRVHAEPQVERGRFTGWRILGFEGTRDELAHNVLREGDVVTRVNGQSIERPEQFKDVWDTMATESQLVLSVQRAGKLSQVRYRIVD